MFPAQFEAFANSAKALIRERLGTDYKIYPATRLHKVTAWHARCAGGTEERIIEKTEIYEISNNLRFRIILSTGASKRATQWHFIMGHIMQKFSKALDKLRAAEAKRLKEKGEFPVLAKSRWCFLKRIGNLTTTQKGRLKKLLTMNLKTVRAYLLKEQFHKFWEYNSPTWAGKFLDAWTRQVMYSNIEPMRDVAKMLRRHRELILNYFRVRKRYNNGIVEELNLKMKLTVRKSYGFRSFKVIETALYHQLGDLPEPEFTHDFW